MSPPERKIIMCGQNEIRKLAKAMRKRGFTITTTGGGHVRYTHPDMIGPVFSAASPSDTRWLKNFQALIRRKMKAA